MRLLQKDTVATGILVTLASLIVTAGVIWVVLLIAGLSVAEYARVFLLCWVLPLLLLRSSARQRTTPTLTKAIIITVFITFVGYMFFLLRGHYIEM